MSEERRPIAITEERRAAAVAWVRLWMVDDEESIAIEHLQVLDDAGLIERTEWDDVDFDDAPEGYEVDGELWSLNAEGRAFVKEGAFQ